MECINNIENNLVTTKKVNASLDVAFDEFIVSNTVEYDAVDTRDILIKKLYGYQILTEVTHMYNVLNVGGSIMVISKT